MGKPIVNFPAAEGLTPDPLDPDKMWLRENELPETEHTEVNEPPLKSDDTPPASHTGNAPEVPPACPKLHRSVYKERGCGGLPGFVAERARAYQLASIEDPSYWSPVYKETADRKMRNPSAMGIYRLIAHFNYPEETRQNPDPPQKLLQQILFPDNGNGRTNLQTWQETSDFFANGILRLLFLFSDKTWAPDINNPGVIVPLIPCELQQECVNQLLGFKYFGDERARHPGDQNVGEDRHAECYWSENHLILFATAEYLAGQLLMNYNFQPVAHYRDGNAWKTKSDPSWAMTPVDRMNRAFPRIIRWLDHRLMFGFSEWNSPIYLEYEFAALLNLIDFCDSETVHEKASMVLDVLLIDLARFAGHGHSTGTAGRAYPSHKFTSWGASICDTLQILFGHWDIELQMERVLEDWRIEKAETVMKFRKAELEKQLEDEEIDRAKFDKDLLEAQNIYNSDKIRRKIIPFHMWNVADSVGAHSLATSKRYCIPLMIFSYAYESPDGRFERSRVSVDFEDASNNYNIGFSRQIDILDWWSRGGFAAPLTAVGSRNLANAWTLQKFSPFKDLPLFFTLPDPLLVAASSLLSVESLGSCLTTANLCLWREGQISMSSAQKFRFGQVGRQVQVWQVNIGPYITIWSTYPAAESSESDDDGPSWWGGNAAQPRVVQRDGALICIHDSNLFSYTHLTYGYRSHAWFPVRLFHEAYEVRRPEPDNDDDVVITNLFTNQSVTEPFGLDAARGGVWWFGRWRDNYVGLFSAKNDCHLLKDGRWSYREILCEDRVNIFICQVGSKQKFGTFKQFIEQCCKARIHVGLGVYQPSNPFVDIQCSYDVPFGKRLSLNLEDRYPAWHGTPFSDEHFPRWDTQWSFVPWGQRSYSLSAPDFLGNTLVLNHDCVNGIRTGNGI